MSAASSPPIASRTCVGIHALPQTALPQRGNARDRRPAEHARVAVQLAWQSFCWKRPTSSRPSHSLDDPTRFAQTLAAQGGSDPTAAASTPLVLGRRQHPPWPAAAPAAPPRRRPAPATWPRCAGHATATTSRHRWRTQRPSTPRRCAQRWAPGCSKTPQPRWWHRRPSLPKKQSEGWWW